MAHTRDEVIAGIKHLRSVGGQAYQHLIHLPRTAGHHLPSGELEEHAGATMPELFHTLGLLTEQGVMPHKVRELVLAVEKQHI